MASGEALKYMTVPEKIDLSNSGTMGYPQASQQPASHKYNPMKIPDTITLDTGGGGRGMSGDIGGGERHLPSEAKKTEDYRQVQPKAEGEKMLPHMSSDRFEVPSSTHPSTAAGGVSGSSPSSDLERRVTTLETKLERLTETFLSSQQNPRGVSGSSAIGGSRFWYVVTFAGWMMVPLIVVCMYQFRNK